MKIIFLRVQKTACPMKTGFTLIELLITIAIISILVSLMLPVLSKARGVAKKMACIHNLKQTGTAVSSYITDHDTYLPQQGTAAITNWKYETSPYLGIAATSYNQEEHGKGVFSCPSWIEPEPLIDFLKGGYAWNFLYCGYNENSSPPDVYLHRKKLVWADSLPNTILAGDTTDWKTGGDWNYGNLYTSYYLLNMDTTPPSNCPVPPVGNRHQRGINTLRADFHVEWNSQAMLLQGKTGDTDWYYKLIHSQADPW